MRAFVASVVLCVAPLFLSSPAAACSGPTDYVFSGLFPRSGDNGVPVNAHVFTRAEGFRNDGGQVTLDLFQAQGDGGFVRVPAAVTELLLPFANPFEKSFELVPDAPLIANGTFEVREADHVLGTFATSAQADLSAPPPAAVLFTELQLQASSTCYAGKVRTLEVDYPSGNPSSEPILFEFRSEDGGQLIGSREDRGAFALCDPNYVGAAAVGHVADGFGVPAGVHTLQVRTIDRAGNRSEPRLVTYTASCESDLDAGNESTDAGMVLTDIVEESNAPTRLEPSGCAIGGAAVSPLGLVLAFALGRRQRARRTPSSR